MYPDNFRYTKEHEWVHADGDAWLVKIRLGNLEELQHLMSAADYQSYVGAEK